jgi:serine/threonine-protein kinase HipA
MLTIQLFIDSSWHDAAVLDIKEPRKGRNSQAILAYEFTYALDYLDRDDLASCSLHCPVNLIGSHHAQPWFGFLDDIMPAGASRRYWINHLGLQGKSPAEQDYQLLKAGTIERGVPASIINMPGMGFDYLDQRIDSWRLQ